MERFADWPRLELPDPKGGPPEVYVLDLFPTSKALEWQQRLANLGLEPLAMLLSERELPWATATDADLAVVARALLSKVNAEGLSTFLRELLSGVYVLRRAEAGEVPEPLAKHYDQRFKGRSLDVYRLAGWVLGANFRDFIAAVSWIGAALQSRFRGESASGQVTAEATTPTSTDPATSSSAPNLPT